jgi:hypothetical protein
MVEREFVFIEDEDPDEQDGNAPDDLVETLYDLQDALLRYPMVVQRVFSALVAEGKRFAETPEGAALRDRLLASKSTASARMLWELLTAHSFTEDSFTVLPSAFVERLVQLIAVRGLEPLVSRVFERVRR